MEVLTDHGEMHEGEVAHSEFLIARGDAARLFEAAHAPLDSFAPAIVLTVEVRGAMAAAFACPALRVRLGNARHDVPLLERAPHAAQTVTPVQGRALRPHARPAPAPPDAHAVEHRFDEARLVGLPGTEYHVDGQSTAFNGQMQFGAEAAAAASQSVIRGLAAPPPRAPVFFPRRRHAGAPGPWSHPDTRAPSPRGRPGRRVRAAPRRCAPRGPSAASAQSGYRRSPTGHSARANPATARPWPGSRASR